MVRSNASSLALLLVASLGAVACKGESGDSNTEAWVARSGLNDYSHRVPDAALVKVRGQLDALDFSQFSQASAGQACSEPANKSAQAYAINWYKQETDSSGRTTARGASTYAGSSVVEPASVYGMSVKANGQVLENGRVARAYKWTGYNVVQDGKRIATEIQNRRGPMIAAESAGEYFTFGTVDRDGEKYHYLASSECDGLCGVFAKGSDTLQLVNGACWGIHMDARLHADMKANKPLTQPGLTGEAQSYQAARYNTLTLFLMPRAPQSGNGDIPNQQNPGTQMPGKNQQQKPTTQAPVPNQQQRPPSNTQNPQPTTNTQTQQRPSGNVVVPVQQAPSNTQNPQAPTNTQTQQQPTNTQTQQTQSGTTDRPSPTFQK